MKTLYASVAVTLNIFFFVYVHLRCIANNLKKISKISTLPPWKNFCGRPCAAVLTDLSMAFCQGQQACISGHTLSSSLQNCKVAISVIFISWFFLNAWLLPEYRLMSIPSLNYISTIQCSQVGKRYRNASVYDVHSLFNKSNFDYGS